MIRLNLNPKGIKACDCVIRAIAYATQQSWEDVYKELSEIGFKMKRMPNEKQVYEKYLEEHGWAKQKQPRKYDLTKYDVNEFIKQSTFMMHNYESGEFDKAPYSKQIIVSVAKHLTCITWENDNYELCDTWDCGRKCVNNYWIKEEEDL